MKKKTENQAAFLICHSQGHVFTDEIHFKWCRSVNVR